MMTATEARQVARKRQHGGERAGSGRPKSDRDDVSVKVDRKVIAKAQYLAKLNSVSLAEFISEAMRSIVDPAFAKATKESDN